MNLFAEPDDHAMGRSRGGLSTKIHALVDGKGNKGCSVVERNFNIFKQWRALGIPIRQTRPHLPRRSSPPSHKHLANSL